MTDRRNMSRLAIASLLAAAVCAPTAAAMPIDNSGSTTDMHASTVQKPASASQDLRSEAAVPGARAPVSPAEGTKVAKADLRSENPTDPTRAPKPSAGVPTWPTSPKPIAPVSAEPVAGDGDGGGLEWPVAVLALAGALALGGAVGIAGHRLRAQTRPAS
jgi:hypothetical protein